MQESWFLLENAAWPAVVVDDSAIIRRANRSAAQTFGAAVEGKNVHLSTLWAAENDGSPEVFLTRWERSPVASVTLRLRTKEGVPASFSTQVCLVSREGQKHFTLQFARQNDSATAGDNVESSLAHKQKLDCALKLTRTVALDFNNALTTILGHTSHLLSRIERNHPWRNSLVEVEKSAEKAAEIAHDLAAFSLQEKDSRSQQSGNLNDLLRRTVELFRAQSKTVSWVQELEPKLYTAQFDEAKMQQAFLKVLENAVQAAGTDGQVRVATSNRDVAEATQEGSARLAPGSYVCIEIQDNGCGIPAEVLPRVFEPFFTTKGQGHRGLGLAWVYGIVTNHGGSVAISSEVGKGTSVRFFLPAQKKIVRDQLLSSDNLGGSETILIIDDEDLLLTMGEMVLSSYGYKVLTANSGQKGLEIFSRAPAEIALVITDLVMPRMSGREVMEHLRRIAPGVRIICSSGYVRGASTDNDETYLQKPFSSQDLLRKVKQALTSS